MMRASGHEGSGTRGLASQIKANQLLAALPGSTLRLVAPLLKPVALTAGAVVYDIGDEIDRVYFPYSGLASLQLIMKDSRAVDTAIVGFDGAFGAMAFHGPCRLRARCVARTAIEALTISAVQYRRVAAEDAALQMIIIRYQDRLLSQTQTSAVRYAYLSVGVRVSTCLIEVSNLLGTNIIPLTQEAISEMLSVRRSSVTAAACQLQAAGIIVYTRGLIQILDRERLIKLARCAKRQAPRR
jgi:CRP-like cAMP-binding protein